MKYKIKRFSKNSYTHSQRWDDAGWGPEVKDYFSTNRKECDINTPEGMKNFQKYADIELKKFKTDGRGVTSSGIFNRHIQIRNDFDPKANGRKPGIRDRFVMSTAQSEKDAYREYLNAVRDLGLKDGSGRFSNKEIKDALRKQAKEAAYKKGAIITALGATPIIAYGGYKIKSKKNK